MKTWARPGTTTEPSPRGGSRGAGGWARGTFPLLLLLTLLFPLLPSPAAGQRDSHAGQGQPPLKSYTLHVSSLPDRSRGIALEEKAVVSGNVHIFVTPPVGIARVRFFLDPSEAALEDPLVAGTPREIDEQPPYDFSGTDAKGAARPFDTRQLPDGRHAIVAAIDLQDGTTEVAIARFIVHNGSPALLFSEGRMRLHLPAGGRTSKALKLLTSNAAATTYIINSNAPWLRIEAPLLSQDSQSGSAPGVRTISVDTAGLAPGTYTATISAEAPGYSTASLPVTMEVSATATCSPLACSEILVSLPYELSFSQDSGKILDANGVGTGFTFVDPPTNGTGYIPQNLTVDFAASGTLKATTTAGIQYTSSNSQDNALAVGIDAPSQVSVISTTLLNPPAGSGNYEQAGLWFGNDEDNYVKLIVMSTPKGPKIQYLMEVNGSPSGSTTKAVSNLTNATVSLSLRADPSDQTIAASYSIDGASTVSLGELTAPPEFFSFDAAGIDPTIGTRSFGGIFATNRKGPSPLVYTFDDFSVVAGTGAPGISTELLSGDINFDRSSFALPRPTSMVWGPDGRLYVTELFGTIHAITLNDARQVVADEIITTLGKRLTLGITVDPLSTPDNVILWVSHSSPSTSNGELNSSMVTRLSDPGFTTRADVITGLPRAIANHAINSLHFGPDGKLYIAQGGNTGAGAPNEANTEFGTRAEQPLSAAVLVADVRAPGFDGSCATVENTYGPSPCDVVPYATGLRNSYDFVWHSNGFLYAPDNGLGVTGTYPPASSPPCEGFGDPTPWTQGGDNPGEQPDLLVRLERGKYYGHPNPYRNECVFKDGSYQGVAPLPNYTAPIHILGKSRSADGTIEYKSDAFCGTMKGEILIANYSVGDDITRIRLAADGRSVVSARQLAGGFDDPLPLAQGPDGTIYVGEFGGSKVTALKPRNLGCWATRQAMPAAVLDAGGTALDGKLYVVGGKTSSGHQSTMVIYDPAADRWAAGASLPAAYPAVENPAVAAYNGKLYVFGGSTGPFSGAVANAAVFNPANSSWTMLAAMPTARGGATAQAINGKLYVVGGMDGNGASLASVEVYNPANNTWSSATPLGTRRDNPGSATFGGTLYIFGGRTRDANDTEVDGTLATVEMYDPGTNTWTSRAPMPTGRRTMVVGTLNGRAQVMGGERTSTGGTFPQNEEYEPTTDSWVSLTPMLTARHGAVAGTINGTIYVVGGGPTGGTSFTDVNEAFSFSPVTTTSTPNPPTPTNTPAAVNSPTSTPAPTNTPSAGNSPTSTPTAVASSGGSYMLLVSFSPDRSNPVPLENLTVSGNIFAFTSPDSGVARVRFYLDDPTMTGPPRQVENNAPYDFAGGTVSTAKSFNTKSVADGPHTITAAIELTNGTTDVVDTTFTVAKATTPALTFSPTARSFAVSEGTTDSQTTILGTTDGTTASYMVSDDAPWLTVGPENGTTPASLRVTVDANGLTPGTYSATVSAGAPGYTSATLSVALTVGGAQAPDQVHLAWVEDPSTTLTVVWHSQDTATPSTVEYRPLASSVWQRADGTLRASGTTGTLHEVTIGSLTPSTPYEYRVQGDGSTWSAIFSTRTAPPHGSADFDAIYVADTGLVGREDGLATGTQQVVDEIAALQPLLVLPGGDYAYFNTDKRFGTLDNTIDVWFYQMQPIASRSPLMPTYGNHEVLLKEGFQPWADRFPTPEGFDGRRNYSFDVGDVHFVSILAVYNSDGLTGAQVQWLEQDIAAATAAGQRWIIPYFHVSPFSDGTNHPSNSALRAQLGPLFERLGVKLVLSAHDQSYERTYPLIDVPATNTPTSTSTTCYTMEDGVTWVKVSPGGKLSNINGSFSSFATDPPPAWTAFRDNTMHHFARLIVSAAGSIRLDAYGVKGDGTPPIILDSFQYTTGRCP